MTVTKEVVTLLPMARRPSASGAAWQMADLVAALVAVALLALPVTPTSAATRATAPRTLSGSIVDPAGQPIAGARVTLAGHRSQMPECSQLSTTLADAAGRFQFYLPGAGEEQLLLVYGEAPGVALTGAIVWEPALDPMKLVLGEPTTIEVRTVDRAGTPVAGLRVQPDFFFAQKPFRAFALPRPLAERFAQTTDADGVARFAGLPRDVTMGVKIVDARFANPLPREQNMRLQGDRSAPRTLTLVPGATIRGAVRYAGSGNPAPGVLVIAKAGIPGNSEGHAVTDAEGRYDLTQLRPGTYHVMPWLPPELAELWTARARKNVEVASGAAVGPVDLELISGAAITGQVTAEDTSEPQPDVHFVISNSANHEPGSTWHAARSDREGRYTFRVVPGEHVFLSMIQPPAGFRLPEPARLDATLGDGEKLSVDFRLRRRPAGEMVRFRVVDATGQVVPSGDVYMETAPLGGTWNSIQADARGNLHLAVDNFSRSVRIRARQGDRATPEPVVITAPGEATVKLVPNVLGRLRGKVVDPAAKPISGVKLTLMEWIGTGSSGEEAATSGQDGSFEIRHLWPGAAVSVQAEAVRWKRETTERVEIKAGEMRELPPLVLQPAVLSLAGRLVDEKSAPVAEFSVSFQGEHSAGQESITDGDGCFRFEGLAEGKVRLFAGGYGGLSGFGEAAAGDTRVEIVVKPPPPALEGDAAE